MFFSNSELRVLSAEQRALKAEEALQAALDKIQDLERHLQGQSGLEPKSSEGTETKTFYKPRTEAQIQYHS